MIGEELQRGAEDGRIGEPGAQIIGGKPGEFEIARGAVLAFEHPAKGGKRKRVRIGRTGGRGAKRFKDCPELPCGLVER